MRKALKILGLSFLLFLNSCSNNIQDENSLYQNEIEDQNGVDRTKIRKPGSQEST
jgi:hypothetical protein